MIKRNAWHSEGFYQYGCYTECYESGCWDATPSTRESLISSGYLIDEKDIVWNRSYGIIYLEHELKTSRRFDTFQELNDWAEDIKKKSGKTFEIVKYGV